MHTQVAKHARDRPLAEGFSTDELEFKSTLECAYVEETSACPSLQHVSVYHSRSSDGLRGVYATMLPATNICVTLVRGPQPCTDLYFSPLALRVEGSLALTGCG